MRRKIVIIGIDGATWSLLMTWIKDGHLPALAAFTKNGIWGYLESTIPPTTIPAWNSLSSGMRPEDINIYAFMHRIRNFTFKPYFSSMRYKKVPYLWDILTEHNLKSIVLNVPVIHKPYRINGYMVAGFLYLDENNLTYPSELKRELDNVVGGYEVDIVAPYPLTKKEDLKRLKNITIKQINAFKYLLKRKEWDLAFIVITATDTIQHRYYDDKKALLDFYMTIDRHLVEIKDIVNMVTNGKYRLFIVSDHGFGPAYRVFYINTWLYSQGLLRLKKKPNKYIQCFNALASRSKNFLLPLIPLSLRKRIKSKIVKESSIEEIIDPESSVALGYGNMGLIYLNDTLSEREYRDKVNFIAEELKKLGMNILKKNEIYKRPEAIHDKRAPDIVITIDDNVSAINTSIGKCLFSKGKGGNHRLDGIFVIYPCMKREDNAKKLQIYDIAPSVLEELDIDVPKYIYGTSISEKFNIDL